MEKFYKTISVVLHPIVIPTIGVFLYFFLTPNNLESQQKLAILSLVFITTYLIPLLILIIFKKIKLVKSFKTKSIRERKLPIAIMIILFYLLGNTIVNISQIRDLGILFYASSFGLILIYFLFGFNLKTSIHLMSIGIATSFFLILGEVYPINYVPIIIIGFLFAGLLGNARLYLNAHTTTEVYLGFFTGFIAPISVYLFL